MHTMTSLLKKMKQEEKLVMLTAYDYPSAKLAEAAGVDIILVGDSLGMVVLGYDSTIPVTISDMVHHAKAVRRGARDTFVVVDMPFGSFHSSWDRTLENAMRIFQQTSAQALKLEGAGEVLEVTRKLVGAGIPIVAHLGLLPQSAAVLGGYKVQGKTASAAKQLIEDAKACEAAGACMLVLECIPHQLAAQVTKELTIPVIGIGAGSDTDGQVLVLHDMLGLSLSGRVPKFVKNFMREHGDIPAAIAGLGVRPTWLRSRPPPLPKASPARSPRPAPRSTTSPFDPAKKTSSSPTDFARTSSPPAHHTPKFLSMYSEYSVGPASVPPPLSSFRIIHIFRGPAPPHRTSSFYFRQ
jgi:3-methyl-2-oxobutanoate hydroxymethyltransferase